MKIYLLKRKGKLSKENLEKGRSVKVSLYLMYHFGPNQKREYEWLDLFLYDKPKNQIQKDHNKQTWQLAETIKAKKMLDDQTSAHGFVSKIKSRICFVAYFKTLVDKKESIGNYGNWLSTYGHLVDFIEGKALPLETVDERFLEAFREYLLSCKVRKGKSLTKLNQNSAASYFNKVRAALRVAFKEKMIKENPAMRVKCISEQSTHRQFLTFEELQKLAKTECKLPIMKKMLLVSALTGLRCSDLKNLKWDNIRYSEQDGYSIQYTQKKTKKAEILPIANHVVEMLGERVEASENIFPNFKYSSHNNNILKKFVKDAGINKDITLHNGRHSYACLQLSMGTDINTIRDLLGHSNLKTTMIYTKVLDINKIKAANKIPQLIAS
ncbi:MAG: tyrosine-type recombinase/integrase [Ginsengibacter sp.]